MNRKVLENSIQTLKILYMVVAGLALANGLERFVFKKSGQFEIEWISVHTLFFIIFVTTVARFVHGAMRHFDYYYVEEPQQIKWRGQPLWDFSFLGIEAFIFFILAFSLDNQPRFITYYLWLLLVDTFWLIGVFSPHIKQVWTGRPRNWIIANLIILIPTGIPWFWFHNAATCPIWLLWLFIIGVLAHSIMDYGLNWESYFGQPLRDQSGRVKERLRPSR